MVEFLRTNAVSSKIDEIISESKLCGYLADFKKQGYVFMINHLKQTDITEGYKALVTSPNMLYVTDSWREYKIENTDFCYYASRHKFSIKEKNVCHFIFDVNFANQLSK